MLRTLFFLFAVGACDFVEPGRYQEVMTADQINAYSSIDRFPNTARNVRYSEAYFQDRTEYIYFEDEKETVDEFALWLVGYAPVSSYREFPLVGPRSPKWWTNIIPGSARIGEVRSNVEIRSIMIVDHENYSQTWIYVQHR